MFDKALVFLASLAVGKMAKKIFLYFCALAAIVLLAAVFIFDWRGFDCWLVSSAAVVFLPFLLFWWYVRRYLTIHPLAGDSKVHNYFIGVSSESRSFFWQKGSFYWVKRPPLDLVAFSILKTEFLPKSKSNKTPFQNIGVFDLPFSDPLPPTIPSQVLLRMNLSGPYCREEVLRLMKDIWLSSGALYDSYHQYVGRAFQNFLSSPGGVSRSGFFPPAMVAAANNFHIEGHLETFFKASFNPRPLSNVLSFTFFFSGQS